MAAWYDDPFFDPTQAHFPDMNAHFSAMQNRMSDLMNSMFNGFGQNFGFGPFTLGYDDRPRPALEDHRRSRPIVEEPDYEYPRHRSRSQPIVEEPDDEDPYGGRRSYSNGSGGGNGGFFYSSVMSSYSGPDGVTHAKKKTYNSATGKTQLAEMRKIGDQAVAMKREIDRDGTVRDAMDRKNLREDDMDDFRRRWENRSSRGLWDSHSRGEHGSHHHRRALN
jgi:hypothetical protein